MQDSTFKKPETLSEIWKVHTVPRRAAKAAVALGYNVPQEVFEAGFLKRANRAGRARRIEKVPAWKRLQFQRKLSAQVKENETRKKTQALQSEADKKHREAIRKDILTAARVARQMGFTVRASKDKCGRVSSYYVTPKSGGRPWRISDHDVPQTAEREARANCHGREFNGAASVYASADSHRRPLWWKRAFTLLEAGRNV